MKRNRFYNSKKLPKFTLGFYPVCQRLGILQGINEIEIHDKINSLVKNAAIKNINKFLKKYNLKLGKDVVFNSEIILPENFSKSLTSNYQIEINLKVLNAPEFLKKLKADSFSKRTEPFDFVVDSWGDIQLFESESKEYKDDYSDSLHKLCNDLNHSEIGAIRELRDIVLYKVPQSQYARIFCDTFYPKYLAIKDNVNDFYVMKSSLSSDCYLIDKSLNERNELKDNLNKIEKLKTLRKLKFELPNGEYKSKSIKI